MVDEVANKTSSETSYETFVRDSSLLSVFLIGFVVAFGVSAIPVALPQIASALALSDPQIGLIMTAFYMPMIVFVPITSVLADLHGRKTVAVPSLFLLGITGIATLIVTTFPVLLGLRVLQGIAAAATLPLTAAMIGDLYRGSAGTAAQGLRMSANSLGAMVGPLLAGGLASISWRYPFVLFGLTLPVMGIVYRYYTDPIDGSYDGTNTTGELRQALRSYARTLRGQATNINFAILSVGGFTLFFLKQAIKTFVPLFIVRELGADVVVVGTVLGTYAIIRMAVAPITGVLVGRIGQKPTLVGGLALLGAASAAIPFMPSVRWLVVVVGFFATGEALLNPTLSDAVATFASDELRGGLLSGLQSLKNVANTVSPALLGFVLATSGFRSLFLISTGLAGLYGVAVVVLLD